VVQGLEASVVARYQGSIMASEAQLLGRKDFRWALLWPCWGLRCCRQALLSSTRC
jgi:hypothetical protein